MSSKNSSPSRELTSETDLGSLAPLAVYMKVGRTWLQALKKCAARRALEAADSSGEPNPSPFIGQKSTKARIMAWLERNPDFQAAREYPRKQSPSAPPRDRELSAAGRSG